MEVLMKTLEEIEDMLGHGKDLRIVMELLSEHPSDKVVEFLDGSISYKNRLKDKVDEAKEALIVEHNGVPYQGDFGSINYMSAVAAVAGFKFNQALVAGLSYEEAYELTYKVKIGWRNGNNEVSQVQVESVCETLEKTMKEVASLIGAK